MSDDLVMGLWFLVVLGIWFTLAWLLWGGDDV